MINREDNGQDQVYFFPLFLYFFAELVTRNLIQSNTRSESYKNLTQM